MVAFHRFYCFLNFFIVLIKKKKIFFLKFIIWLKREKSMIKITFFFYASKKFLLHIFVSHLGKMVGPHTRSFFYTYVLA